MNILTKICIVVLVVLNLLTASIFTKLAIESSNYKLLYTQESQKRAAADQVTRQYSLALSEAEARIKTKTADLELQLSTANSEISKLKIEIETAETEKLKLTGLLNTANATATNLTADAESKTEAIKKLTGQLQDAKEAVTKRNDEIRSLNSDLQEARAVAERLDKSNKLLRETLTEERERVQALIASGGKDTAGTGDNAVTTADVEISGSITGIDKNIASINVGSTKGVTKGMKFIVYRNDKLVAYLRIDEVDTDSAAGVIEQKQTDPIVGDKAATKLDK